MSIQTAALGRALLSLERRVATLERCQPRNYRAELARLQAAWRCDNAASPRFEYAARPRLSQVRGQLQALLELSSCGPWGEFVAQRAAEIDAEAAMLEALGSGAFVKRAFMRFGAPNAHYSSRAFDLARQWVASEREASAVEPRFASDDETTPHSLISQVRALLGPLRLPFRAELHDNLAALAATGSNVILVATGRMLTAAEARRVAVHEVFGHAVPRANAARDPSRLMLAGTAGAGDDEEGRALRVEERHGLLHPQRRFQLALRHFAARALFDGADYCEVVRLLRSFECDWDVAVAIAARVFRGGGLGREIVYLPAMLRVTDTLTVNPMAEACFERGRIAAAWVNRLMELGDPPEQLPRPRYHTSSATTGA